MCCCRQLIKFQVWYTVNLVTPNISRLTYQENQAVCLSSAAIRKMEDIRVEILVYPNRKFELQLKWGKILKWKKIFYPPTPNSVIQIEMVGTKSKGGNYVFA